MPRLFPFIRFMTALNVDTMLIRCLDYGVEEIPNNFVAVRRSSQTIRAPVKVFPAPGGPWIGRTPPIRCPQRRTAASTVVSACWCSGCPPTRGGSRSKRSRAQKTNKDLFDNLGHGVSVGGGTAWLWSRLEARDRVDVLFVDEAAQMSLADVLAVSQAAKTLVLIGDPQQLDQPTQASHPDGTDIVRPWTGIAPLKGWGRA
jgi:AAA domain